MSPIASPPASSESSLVRALGVWGLAASIINVTVGGGIFGLPARVAGEIQPGVPALGAAAPLAYMVCAVGMGLIVLCIAEAGSRVSLTGGPYAYVEIAFGPYVGFVAGVLLWLLGTTAVAAVSTLFVASAARLFPHIGLGEWGPRALLLVITFALLTAVNVRGVRQGTRVNAIFTVAKLLPLLLLIAVGAFFVRRENLAITGMPSARSLATGSILLIFAFSGVESALVPSGEVKDTARTVPRALFIAMLGITLLYISIQLVAQGILGPDITILRDTPLAEAAGRALGPAGRTLLLVGATISMFGYVSGMTLAVPRALYAFGRDGFLPASLARVHPRFHTPHLAIITQSVIVCALAVSGTFESLAIVSNVAVLLLYGACCVASWALRRRDVRAGGATPFRVPAAGVVPIAGVLVILFMLSSLPLRELAVVLVVLAVATVIFLITRGRRAQLAAPAA
jgi:APA family basic amino acid/polyamine antiporter